MGAYDGTLFDRHPVDGAHARLHRGPVRRLCFGIRRRERKQHTLRDDRAHYHGGAERAGDVDAARDDGGETQLKLMFAVRINLPPSPRRVPAGEGAGPLNSAAAGPVGASSAARKSASAARAGRIDGRPIRLARRRGAPRSPGGRRRPSMSPTRRGQPRRARLETAARRRRGAPAMSGCAGYILHRRRRRARPSPSRLLTRRGTETPPSHSRLQ